MQIKLRIITLNIFWEDFLKDLVLSIMHSFKSKSPVAGVVTLSGYTPPLNEDQIANISEEKKKIPMFA